MGVATVTRNTLQSDVLLPLWECYAGDIGGGLRPPLPLSLFSSRLPGTLGGTSRPLHLRSTLYFVSVPISLSLLGTLYLLTYVTSALLTSFS